MNYEHLKLDNQICFPIYAASRLITREYQPFLDKLGITYPQYLVLLVLWEKDDLSVNEIKDRLILNTNTVTPLLQRMETLGLVARERSQEDERKVIISLTKKGSEMKEKAAEIPKKLLGNLEDSELKVEEIIALKQKLDQILEFLSQKKS